MRLRLLSLPAVTIGLLLSGKNKAFAWCDVPEVHCGDVISSTMHTDPFHTDINTYSCTESMTWLGNAKVYRYVATTTGDSLCLVADWTSGPNSDTDLGLFILEGCDQNACLAFDPHHVCIYTVAGHEYWIVLDGRTNDANAQSFVLSIYCGDHRLAAELTAFSGAAREEGIQLDWSVASETDNSHFAVERLFGEDDWQIIGQVAGRGTATSAASYSFIDQNVSGGERYRYRLMAFDDDGSQHELGIVVVEYNHSSVAVSGNFRLIDNFPNPFNPATTIRYETVTAGTTRLDVYAVDGRLVQTLVNGNLEAGLHTVQFNASNLASGIYFAHLSGTTGATATMKMVLMK